MNPYPYSCPYCNYHITPENVLFQYNTRQLPYRDMRRYAFYRLCSSSWPLESDKFEGLYFLPSDAEDDQVVRDKDGFPLVIRVKPCNGKTPTELESMTLPGESLADYITQYENRNPSAHAASAPMASALSASAFGFQGAAQTDAASAEIKPADDGTVIAIATRACPNCHNELHQRFGQIPTINVTLLGGPSAGKTAYLLSLTHQLSVQLAAHRLGTAELLKASAQYFNFLDQGYQSMQTTMPTVRDEKLFPFVFHFRGSYQKECFVKLFDIAGETTDDPNSLLNHRGIMEASTLMLILDPNQLNQGLFGAKDGVSDIFHEEIPTFVQKSIANNLPIGAFQNISKIIAVFSKMDMVLQADPKRFGAGQTDVDCVIRYDLGQAHTGALDEAVINHVQKDMDVMINTVTDRRDFHLRDYLRSLFGLDRKISTLLLGVSTHTLTDPQNIVFENDCSHRASKHRIIEPFLCILAQNNMIPVRPASKRA